MFIRDPATADSIGAAATVVNTQSLVNARLTSAWDPITNAILLPGYSRTYTQVIGTTSYTAHLSERAVTNGLAIGTSERFDQWTLANGCTVTPDTTAAPNGEMNAQTLTDPGGSLSSVQQVMTVTSSSNTIPLSVYVLKTAGGTAPVFGMTAVLSGGTPVTVNARINTDTGAQAYGSNANTTVVNASSTYWRVIILITDNASGNTSLTWDIYPAAAAYGGTVDDASATGSCVCTYACKQNAAAATKQAGTYTSNRNMLLRTQEFGTAWTQTRVTITSDSTANPIDSVVNADTIVEDSSVTNTHYIRQNVVKPASAIQFIFSAWLKQSGRTWAYLGCSDNGTIASGNGAGKFFDLANGVTGVTRNLGTGWTLDASTITAVGSWYLCTVTVTSNSSADITAYIAVSNGDNGLTFSGNGTASIIGWGAQLSYGSMLLNYWAVSSTVGQKAADAITTTIAMSTTVGTLIAVSRPLNWSNHPDNTTVIRFLESTGTGTDLSIRGASGATNNSQTITRGDASSTNPTGGTLVWTQGVSVAQGMTWSGASVREYENGFNHAISNTGVSPYNAVAGLAIGSVSGGGSGQADSYIVGFYWGNLVPFAQVQNFCSGVVQ